MKNLQDYLAHLDKLTVVGGESFSKSFQVETQSGDIADITYRVDTHEETYGVNPDGSPDNLTFQAILLVSVGGNNVFRWGADNGDENAVIVQWVAKKMRMVLAINQATQSRVEQEFASFVMSAE
jgi:hypothetical protein